jgi:hypothetical protein
MNIQVRAAKMESLVCAGIWQKRRHRHIPDYTILLAHMLQEQAVKIGLRQCQMKLRDHLSGRVIIKM